MRYLAVLLFFAFFTSIATASTGPNIGTVTGTQSYSYINKYTKAKFICHEIDYTKGFLVECIQVSKSVTSKLVA